MDIDIAHLIGTIIGEALGSFLAILVLYPIVHHLELRHHAALKKNGLAHPPVKVEEKV